MSRDAVYAGNVRMEKTSGKHSDEMEREIASYQLVLRNCNSHVFNDHSPPLHVEYGERKAIIDLENLNVKEGNLPPKGFQLVREWAEIHKKELLDDWELCRQKLQPRKI